MNRNSSAARQRARHGAGRAAAFLGLFLAGAAFFVQPSGAQEPAPSPEILPTGSADLTVSGRPVLRLPFTLTPSGPRFALAPIATALGVDLRIGPKGESHSLIFDDRKILIGPGQALMMTLSTDGKTPEEMTTLRHLPIKDAQGLKVAIEFLERSFGERLGVQFDWDPQGQALRITRRELRELQGSINLVHQHGFSTVEMRFSERPRYQVEQLPGALEIRLIGDRLRVPPQRPQQDPLVSAIVTAPDRIRIELAPNATAAEPRLLQSPISLIVEVIPGSGASASTPAPSPSDEPQRAYRPRRPSKGSGLRTIVLDPGHGGEHTGAVGPSGTTEAELTLQVGRALKRELERRLPVRVVLTRTGDVDLPHDNRTAIANQNKADLFISLHFNSSYGAWAHGAETYFLSREASDQLAAEAAAVENRTNDPDDPELGLQMILWDLAQSRHLAESQRFASLVQEELNQTLGLRDRGVKQAPFRVLMGAMMPAVLVELGFLSNPEEEAKLLTPSYISELIDCLVRAVVRFKNQLEAREASLRGAAAGPGNPSEQPAPASSEPGAPPR